MVITENLTFTCPITNTELTLKHSIGLSTKLNTKELDDLLYGRLDTLIVLYYGDLKGDQNDTMGLLRVYTNMYQIPEYKILILEADKPTFDRIKNHNMTEEDKKTINQMIDNHVKINIPKLKDRSVL